jgi:hypothetical protein
MSVLRSIRFPDDIYQMAKQHAERQGVSFNVIVVGAVGAITDVSGVMAPGKRPLTRTEPKPTEAKSAPVATVKGVRPEFEAKWFVGGVHVGPIRQAPGSRLKGGKK